MDRGNEQQPPDQPDKARAARTAQEADGPQASVIAGVAIGIFAALVLIVATFNQVLSANRPSAPPPVVATRRTPPAAPKPAVVETADTKPSTDPAVQPDGGLDYLGLKAEAEEKLDGILNDDHGVRYRDVHTKLSTMDGGGIVAFCGEENSRTPDGGYGGFQRFIASRSTAITEDKMTPDDFAQAWGQFCDGGVEGPKVWF